MRFLIAISLSVFMSTASAQTGLPAPCDTDFGVYPEVEGQPAENALVDASHVSRTSRRAEDESKMMIALDETGAERMREYTRENIGEKMIVTCDGKAIWRARIAAEFGDRFEIRFD